VDHEVSEESRVGSARRDQPQKTFSETTKAARAGGLEGASQVFIAALGGDV